MQQYELHSQSRHQPPNARPQGRRSGTFMRGIASGIFAFIALSALLLGSALIGYAVVVTSSDLPAPGELLNRVSTFQNIRILDRDGSPINEIFDPNAGKRTFVPLTRISPYLVQATIATEDANFYDHPGVDPIALTRAIYYAVQEGDIVSGASTIPQQLSKMLFLSPEQTLMRKIREAILSSEISRAYEKDEILEIYLNELYYGNLAYGAAAAAQTYYNKDVAELTLAEAALLAGIPQLPAVYDPYAQTDRSNNRAKTRQGVVLGLMVKTGYISQAEADAAWLEPLVYAPLNYDLNYPHFTLYVRQQLETIVTPLLGSEEALFKEGLNVTTTLVPRLQDAAQRIVWEHVSSLSSFRASNGALVAIDPNTGEIQAMVGSTDFDNIEIDGQVNMALAPRQPGSSIKPLAYLSTFEQPTKPVEERWTPGTMVADIKEEFPDGVNPPYVPTNYDKQEHGIVTVRDALARSYNIPAVRALQTVGLPDFLELAQRLGISTLTRPDYGLSLSLGSGEIPLLEMTGAYAILANGGRRIEPMAIRQIQLGNGTILCQIQSPDYPPCTSGLHYTGEQVINPIDAFLISDILSDNEARTPVFGPDSWLKLTTPNSQVRPAAAKTGTTNDVRDVLTLGYTPQLVTGVWVGNTDNSPMQDLSGARGAAPIWNRFMTQALIEQPILNFEPPPGVRQYEVCADTGTLPSEACPNRRMHWFAEDRPPLPAEEDLYQIVRLDRTTGKLATEFTPQDAIEEKVFKVYPEPYRQWAEENGLVQPPRDASDVFTFEPEVVIRQPVDGQIISGILAVLGTANTPAFGSYELQYGISHEPGAFSAPIDGPYGNPIIEGILGQWDVSGLGVGPHTLRLVVRNVHGNEFEHRVRVFVEAPTATPVPSPTWTIVPPTPTATLIEAATATSILEPPTITPTLEQATVEPPTLTPTVAAVDTETPTPVVNSPADVATPTWTPSQ